MEINGFVIENIIFDLGGVILDIDVKGGFEKFKQLGLEVDQHVFSYSNGNSVFKMFEAGALSANEFRNEIRKASKTEFTDEHFDKIWNSILLNFCSQFV